MALLVSLDFCWHRQGAYKLTYIPVDLAEEVKNAAVAAPVAIITAGTHLFFFLAAAKMELTYNRTVCVTSVLGFFTIVSVCYGIRDMSALPGPTGLVFSQVNTSRSLIVEHFLDHILT